MKAKANSGSSGKNNASSPFRSQSAEKLGKNYQQWKNMST
jgi:hypothetical protein